jgi:hypothetical protein
MSQMHLWSSGLLHCWNSSNVGCLELRQHWIKQQWWTQERHRITKQLKPFCTSGFLLHFATFHAASVMRKSEEQITEYCLQHIYSWNSITISSLINDSNCHPQICSIKGNQIQHVSWGLQIVLIILIPWPQLKWSLSDCSFWPDYHAQQSLSNHSTHFACLPCCAGTHWARCFSPVEFIQESILFVFLWQRVEYMLVEAVSSISICKIWILRITGFSSSILFPCIFGFLYQNWGRISASTLSLKSW